MQRIKDGGGSGWRFLKQITKAMLDREQWGRQATPSFSEDGDQKISTALAFPLQGASSSKVKDQMDVTTHLLFLSEFESKSRFYNCD